MATGGQGVLDKNDHQSGVRAGGRLDSLTGLRALAALAVFFFHSQERFSENNGPLAFIGGRQGSIGVSFFFILSGLVLAWSSREGSRNRDFFRNRAARILPAYYVAAVAGVVVDVVNGTAAGRTNLPGFLLIQSWFPQQDIVFGGNGAGWSLSDEVFFYALFPALLFLSRRLGSASRRWLLAACGLAVILLPAVPGSADSSSTAHWAVFELPVSRLLEFAVGVLLGVLLRTGELPRIPFVPAAALAVASYFVAYGIEEEFRNTSVMLVPLSLLLVSAAQADLAGTASVLRSRPLVKLGAWSYCFYLMHQICIRIMVYLAPRAHLDDWAAIVASFVLSLAAAVVLCELVERPLERRLRSDHRLPLVETAPVVA